MRLLLDTHAFLWWIWDDPRLTPVVRSALSDPTTTAFVSAASAWEIATKVRIGKLPNASALCDRLAETVHLAGFESLPVGLEHARAAGLMPGEHKDPFDRMIAAQARLDGLTVVTADPAIAALGALVLW